MPCASHPTATGSVQVEWTSSRDAHRTVRSPFSAIGKSIKIWDLETKTVAEDVKSEHDCTSLAWSADGQTLFAGFTDDQIRVFEVRPR